MPSFFRDYKEWGVLRVAGSASAVQLSNIPVRMAIVKANPGNAGTAFIGAAGVTTSTGFPLGPGEEVLIALGNLNELYHIGSDGSQPLSVFWQR